MNVNRRSFLRTSALPVLARLAPAIPLSWLAGGGLGNAGERKLTPPGELQVNFVWQDFLNAHAFLRASASRRAAPPAPFLAAVETYRKHQKQVLDPRIWLTLESYIAQARDAESLMGQVKLFPLLFPTLYLEPTGVEIGQAILGAMPAYQSDIWPAVQARRQSAIDPAIQQLFEPNRQRLLTFLFTSLNATPLDLHRFEINLVGTYVLTGHDTREISGRYFTIVETGRFSPAGVLESALMMIGRIIELEDRGNLKGALFMLRQQQTALKLPNPGLFPRAVLYWTAGEAIRRIVDPAHRHVAETLKIYERGLRPFLPALREVWNPYLDGKLSLEEAIKGMIQRVG